MSVQPTGLVVELSDGSLVRFDRHVGRHLEQNPEATWQDLLEDVERPISQAKKLLKAWKLAPDRKWCPHRRRQVDINKEGRLHYPPELDDVRAVPEGVYTKGDLVIEANIMLRRWRTIRKWLRRQRWVLMEGEGRGTKYRMLGRPTSRYPTY